MYLCSARWRICKALPWSSVQLLHKTLTYPLLSKPTCTLCCCHGELLQLLKPLGLLPYQPIYKRPKKGKNTHTGKMDQNKLGTSAGKVLKELEERIDHQPKLAIFNLGLMRQLLPCSRHKGEEYGWHQALRAHYLQLLFAVMPLDDCTITALHHQNQQFCSIQHKNWAWRMVSKQQESAIILAKRGGKRKKRVPDIYNMYK